jgi:hypothetical protein
MRSWFDMKQAREIGSCVRPSPGLWYKSHMNMVQLLCANHHSRENRGGRLMISDASREPSIRFDHGHLHSFCSQVTTRLFTANKRKKPDPIDSKAMLHFHFTLSLPNSERNVYPGLSFEYYESCGIAILTMRSFNSE